MRLSFRTRFGFLDRFRDGFRFMLVLLVLELVGALFLATGSGLGGSVLAGAWGGPPPLPVVVFGVGVGESIGDGGVFAETGVSGVLLVTGADGLEGVSFLTGELGSVGVVGGGVGCSGSSSSGAPLDISTKSYWMSAISGAS